MCVYVFIFTSFPGCVCVCVCVCVCDSGPEITVRLRQKRSELGVWGPVDGEGEEF